MKHLIVVLWTVCISISSWWWRWRWLLDTATYTADFHTHTLCARLEQVTSRYWCAFPRLETVRSMWPQRAPGTLSHYTLHRLRHCPFSSANSRQLCSTEVILTVLHVLNICTFYYNLRRYFSYIVWCNRSHYWLYATLISSLMMTMMMMTVWDQLPMNVEQLFMSGFLMCSFETNFWTDKRARQCPL